MKECSTNYQFPATIEEARKAMRDQALAAIKFRLNKNMTVEEYGKTIDLALSPLKNATKTRKFTIEEFAQIYESHPDKKYRDFYKHELNHTKQMSKILKDMEIDFKPKFSIYVCPILADMYQMGMMTGLTEMEKDERFKFDRKQQLEFDRRLIFEMLKTTKNSSGDLMLVGSIIVGDVVSFFNNNLHK